MSMIRETSAGRKLRSWKYLNHSNSNRFSQNHRKIQEKLTELNKNFAGPRIKQAIKFKTLLDRSRVYFNYRSKLLSRLQLQEITVYKIRVIISQLLKEKCSLIIIYMCYGPINFTDTRAKCSHLKKLTCKGTLRQVFIIFLERQSVMLVFST